MLSLFAAIALSNRFKSLLGMRLLLCATTGLPDDGIHIFVAFAVGVHLQTCTCTGSPSSFDQKNTLYPSKSPHVGNDIAVLSCNFPDQGAVIAYKGSKMLCFFLRKPDASCAGETGQQEFSHIEAFIMAAFHVDNNAFAFAIRLINV